MRAPSKTASTAWGTYLRKLRLKTRVAQRKWRPRGPMAQQAFAVWLAKQSGVPFSWRAYVEWERGTRVAGAKTQAALREYLATAELPFEE